LIQKNALKIISRKKRKRRPLYLLFLPKYNMIKPLKNRLVTRFNFFFPIFLNITFKPRNVFLKMSYYLNRTLLIFSLARFTPMPLNLRWKIIAWLRLIAMTGWLIRNFRMFYLYFYVYGKTKKLKFLLKRFVWYIAVETAFRPPVIAFFRRLVFAHGYRRLKKWPRRKRYLQHR